MESAQSRSLIRETFTQPFDKARFQRFIRELLNHLDESKAENWNKTYVKEAFRPRINRYQRLGTYVDPGGEGLDVLIVHLEKESSLERARTSLRNFAADYLVTRGFKEAALVAFVSPNEADWRFSFVKMEYESAADESGEVKVSERLSPARRYSFLVGANEHSHTAQKQFLPLLENDDYDPTLSEIEAAFDIEKVTKEFFQRYKDLFERVRAALDRILTRNKVVRKDFGAKGIETDDFAKKLLGQIVFLYFLQKKGWFGVEPGAEWGTGNKQFLRYLFDHRAKLRTRQERSTNRPLNFFNDVLEHLFYDALARERDDDYYARFDCRIPFLNGGLFEPLFGYDWVNSEILLPDELFSNSESTKEDDKGTGILDVFDRYNFTVNEAEPLEKEVAVDPEVIGKVFENLQDPDPRHATGTYYTPPVIVNYMCEQSILNYLLAHLPEVPRTDLESFVRVGHLQMDFEAARTGKHKNKFLPESVSSNAQEIDKLLEDIAVCDPAIGSGAFPVGIMQEIVRARLALATVVGMPKHSAYQLKRDAIEKSLYGVDLDPGAVEIAKLRLWLSLIVDEDDIKKIKPLPNLDYKIMQGNSLLEEFAGVKLLDEDLLAKVFVDVESQIETLNKQINRRERELTRIGQREGRRAPDVLRLEKEISVLRKQRRAVYSQVDASPQQTSFQDLHSVARAKLAELKSLHAKFFDETSRREKDELRAQIERVEWEFMQATLSERGEEKALGELEKHRRDNRRNYFLWKFHFAEVFERKGGFDVVIANPPYGAEIEQAHKEILKNRYAHIVERIRNSFLYFMGAAYEITRDRGVVCFILPNEFLFQIYMTKARRFFLENARFLFAINVGEDVFDAIVPTAIVAFQKDPPGSYEIPVADLRDSTLAQLETRLDTHSFPLSSSSIVLDSPNHIFTFDMKTTGLVNKLANRFARLEDFCDDIANGICTSYDDVYIVTRETVKTYKLEESYLKPTIRGGQFNRYYCPDTTGEYVLYITSAFKAKTGKNILSYLAKNRALLVQKSIEKKKGLREWHILFRARYEGLFAKPKLMFRQTADRIVATIDDKVGYFCINSVNVAQVKPEFMSDMRFLLGVTNSSLLNFFYRQISQEAGRVLAEVKPQRLRSLPIAPATKGQQAQIVKFVDGVRAVKRDNPQADTTNMEREIDRLVYKLYELTDDEIAIVEDDTK
jgi:type I restriction-modification system DNA methylase subunit